MDPEKVKELKDKEMIAVKKNQEMLQAKNELMKKAEEKRKAAMAQQGGILKSKRVSKIYYFLSKTNKLSHISLFTGFIGWSHRAAKSINCKNREGEGNNETGRENKSDESLERAV